jgi:putative phage-type endonuclease
MAAATSTSKSRKRPVRPKQAEQVTQGTPEWRLLRCGKVTASRVADVMATRRDGTEAAARRDYRVEILTERLTGIPSEYDFETADMRWGKQQEPFARLAYEALRGVHVGQIPFAQHPSIKWAGASPDGLVGDDGLCEIKCPRSYTHLGYILAGVVPEDYKPQMSWQLACMPEREWVDFISYDPRMPPGLRLFVRRFYRTQKVIDDLKQGVIKFLDDVELLLEQLKSATLTEEPS